MKLQHLRFFVAIVDHGGVMKAAQRLNVSQPSISIALKSLESEFNQPFFDRPGGGQRLRPTESGLRFYEHAVEILRRCESVNTDLQVKKARIPRVRVGVLSTIAATDIMAAVAAVGRLRDLTVQLWEGRSAQIDEWFQAKRVDAVWTTVARATPYSRVLWKEPFVVLAPPGHRLASETKLSIKDLTDEPFVLRSSCELTHGQLRRAGFSPRVVARAERDDLALRLIAQGTGLAIAPASMVDEKVDILPVSGLKLNRAIGLRWRADLPKSAVGDLIESFWSARRGVQRMPRNGVRG